MSATAVREIPFKQWRYEQAEIKGVTEVAIFKQVCRGLYPGLRLRRVNQRVAFVQVQERKP